MTKHDTQMNRDLARKMRNGIAWCIRDYVDLVRNQIPVRDAEVTIMTELICILIKFAIALDMPKTVLEHAINHTWNLTVAIQDDSKDDDDDDEEDDE